MAYSTLEQAALDYAKTQGWALPVVVTPPPVVDPPPVVTPPAASGNVLGTIGARSGKPWNSGIWPFRSSGSAAAYTAALTYVEGRRGFKSDINMGAQYYNTWGDLEGLQILQFLAAADPKCVPVLMLPPFLSGGSWTAAARGDYDAHYKAMGANAAKIMGDRKWAARTAWEANGNWYPWSIVSAGGAAAFKAGFARMIQQMRLGMGAKAANFISVYSLSNLDDKGQGDPLTATYPGDAYVDVIGIDPYDHWQVYGQPAGSTGKIPLLQRVVDFARGHKKNWSVDEWGVHHTNGADPEGKDNPAYITAMLRFMRANAVDLAWESYFQDDAPNNVNSSLFSPSKDANPNSRAAYLAAVK